MEIYDPACGSGGLLIKCEIAMEAKMKGKARTFAPLKLYGQEYVPETWAMANMNMIIHDMEDRRYLQGPKPKNFDTSDPLLSLVPCRTKMRWNEIAKLMESAEIWVSFTSPAEWQGLTNSSPLSIP